MQKRKIKRDLKAREICCYETNCDRCDEGLRNKKLLEKALYV